MRYFVTTFDGAEEVAEKEIKEKLKIKAVKRKGFLILPAKSGIERLMSIERAGIFLKAFNFKELKDYKKQISEIDFSFIKDEFAVECERFGQHKFSSKDIEIATANKIESKVNLADPKTLVYVRIKNNSCLIGIDLFKRKLDKRDYRVKPHPNAVNSSIAYATLVFSDYKKSKSLLDPFCGSGIIPIEAALIGGKEIHASDNQHYCIESTKINSKIAGVKVNTFKMPVEDLIKKLKKKFDFIITDPPIATFKGLNNIYYFYSRFLKNAYSILKPNGILAIVTIRPKPFLENSGEFKLNKSKILEKNGLKYHILIFKKHI